MGWGRDSPCTAESTTRLWTAAWELQRDRPSQPKRRRCRQVALDPSTAGLPTDELAGLIERVTFHDVESSAGV